MSNKIIKENIRINEINRNETLRYLGFGNKKPDNHIIDLVNECEIELLKVAMPKTVYRTFGIENNNDGIHLINSKMVLKGKDIKALLSGCNKAVLLCATLSVSVDNLIRLYQVKDMTKALIMDALANAAIEEVCDTVQKQIQKEYNEYFLTWRYGLGYGDLSLDICHTFLELLYANKEIGLYVNEHNNMIPKKSVAAIIGLGENEIHNISRSCDNCNLKNTCIYKLKGEHCEF